MERRLAAGAEATEVGSGGGASQRAPHLQRREGKDQRKVVGVAAKMVWMLRRNVCVLVFPGGGRRMDAEALIQKH